MKKIKIITAVYTIFVSGLLFSESINDKVETTPYWLNNDYKGFYLSKTGFVGQSKKWLLSDSRSKALSLDESCQDASRQVAEFFSLQITSSTQSKLNVSKNQYSNIFNQRSSFKSNIELKGINRSDIFIKENKLDNYIISFCLIELSDKEIIETKARLEAEKQKINILLDKISSEIYENNYEKAKLSIVGLKNLNIDDEVISEYEKLLEERIKNNLVVSLTLDKNKYASGDMLGFNLLSNQNMYFSLFVKDGSGIKLIYPSQNNSNNFIKGGEIFIYPFINSSNKREFFRIPKNVDILDMTLFSSVDPLIMDFISNGFNGSFVSDKNSYQNFISSCKISVNCKVSSYEVSVESKLHKFTFSDVKVNINNEHKLSYDELFKEALKNKGILFDKIKGKKLIVNINVSTAFSSTIESDIYIVSASLFEIKDGSNVLINKARMTGIYNLDLLMGLIEKTSKSLLSKL